MGINLESISVIAELERNKIKFEFAGSDEVKVCCPFHDDSSPSCHISTSKRLFKCHTADCGKAGDIVSFLARALKINRAAVMLDLGTRYDVETEDKLIDPAAVERWHNQIWQAGPLLKALYDRGVTDELIRKYRLGESEGRITIPIRNKNGYIVNVRKYLPGAPGPLKMRNTRGHSQIRWFPVDQLQYSKLVITGGECKAIVAAEQLNAHGWGCIAATAGEDNVSLEMLEDLRGKEALVYILDIDAAGQGAAKKHCAKARMYCENVYNVVLPLDPDKYPKGDINDFVASEKGDLCALVDNAKEFELEIVDKLAIDTSEPIDLELNNAIHADNARSRMRVKGIVSAMDTTPYLVPKDVLVQCAKDQGEKCAFCPVFVKERREYTIPPESPAILEFIGGSKAMQGDILKSAIGVPLSCRACEFNILTQYNVEDTRVSPSLDTTSKSKDRQPVPAMCIGTGLNLNESYELTGRLAAHPRNQQATLLISEYKAAQDALSTYQVNESVNELSIFWPSEWTVEGIQAKLDHIYADLSTNVTGIRHRQNLHLVTDLTYHSPLYVTLDGKIVKGWVESLIIGDSAQGKSWVTGFLQDHYRLGSKAEMKNASVAGILGGMEKMGERWFISWGVIPINDARLLIMEEIKGMSTDIIGKLTDMRSSGYAEVTKIGKHWKTKARCRLIWVSNPKFDTPLSGYTYGLLAIKELIGSAEDVRRFDIALLTERSEVNSDEIHKRNGSVEKVPHVYTSDLCRSLVLWCWTRSPEEVVFTEEATEAVFNEASKLCNQFSDVFPLVDRGSMRFKLARLAAALAGRLFSSSEDNTRLMIYPAHVEYISQLLHSIYTSTTFGYAEFSEAQRMLGILQNPEIIKKEIENLPFPSEFCKHMLTRDFIDPIDLEAWAGIDRDRASELMSLLARKHAMTRASKSAYRKTPPFIEFLKNLLNSGTLVDRPAHIEESRF